MKAVDRMIDICLLAKLSVKYKEVSLNDTSLYERV